MLPEYFSVDVLMDRVSLNNRWVSEQWQPAFVEPVNPGRGTPQPPECIAESAARTTWRFAGLSIELHPSEGEGYYLNLTSQAPVVFVMWREEEPGVQPGAYPMIVTLSYNEAGRLMDGGEHVDPVPIPDVLRAWLAGFVAVHYKPEPRKKARRNDPFADDGAHDTRGRGR